MWFSNLVVGQDPGTLVRTLVHGLMGQDPRTWVMTLVQYVGQYPEGGSGPWYLGQDLGTWFCINLLLV